MLRFDCVASAETRIYTTAGYDCNDPLYKKGHEVATIGPYSSFSDKEIVIRSWGTDTRLIMGNYCSIAAGTRFFLGAEHRVDFATTYDFGTPGHPRSKGDIVVGHDVWIGDGVRILSGVSIGTGAVIGAGSVLTRSVEPYAIYAGNPAKFIRLRFSPQQIEGLLRSEWWHWPHEEVLKAVPVLCNTDIDTFIAYADKINVSRSR